MYSGRCKEVMLNVYNSGKMKTRLPCTQHCDKVLETFGHIHYVSEGKAEERWASQFQLEVKENGVSPSPKPYQYLIIRFTK